MIRFKYKNKGGSKMKVELRKGSLVDRVSLQGELSEVIEKLKKLYVCQIEVGKDLIICKIKEEKEGLNE